jgi:hypothetical protein
MGAVRGPEARIGRWEGGWDADEVRQQARKSAAEAGRPNRLALCPCGHRPRSPLSIRESPTGEQDVLLTGAARSPSWPHVGVRAFEGGHAHRTTGRKGLVS